MRERTSGVSEILGAVLLISVVSVSIAIVAVGVYSAPPPAEIPHVSAIAVKNSTTNKTLVVHEGGDDLDPGDFMLLADDGTHLDPLDTSNVTLRKSDGTPGEWPWSIGEILYVSYPTSKVGIISGAGGGESLTETVAVETTGSDYLLAPDVPVIPPHPKPCPCVDDYITFTRCGLQSGSEYYCCAGCVHGYSSDLYGNLNFTITGTGSYIELEEHSKTYLQSGDKISIRISPGGHPTVQLLMNGNLGWSLSVTDISNGYLKIYRNGDLINDDYCHYGCSYLDLDDSWFTGYSNLTSTLTMKSSGTSDSHTSLMVNGLSSPIVDQDTSDEFMLYNLMPATPNLWIIRFPYDTYGNDRCGIYIGKVSTVSRGSTQIFPVP